ncbi:hypothetical protein [Methylobacterium planeticum]|uniref:Uncharacterized protein n=1 Tax=Methylobacterium planeticum TaxID=2615211 RepID=A0A6N6MV61_9HYPH|nr:hypothetical protein [Methylobacterium planeticum]KAB1075620.1 hypothetical protein F6X51_02770 [Methylobacterium planeticum]
MTARGARRGALALGLILAGTPLAAADLFEAGPGPASPRYFPRSDGDETPPRLLRAAPRPLGCLPRRVPVPTNAPDDPSYVGSNYGLSKPSYYGLTPPPGIDDPYGRPLRPYCG